MKRLTSDALGLMRRRFHRVLAQHGCRTTDHFAGFQITGRLRTAELVELMSVIPEGSTELMVHPGRCGPALRAARTRLKESREAELAALVAPEVRAAMLRHGVELVNYAGLEADGFRAGGGVWGREITTRRRREKRERGENTARKSKPESAEESEISGLRGEAHDGIDDTVNPCRV